VIANHMLYHVQSIPKALKEIYRVMRPSGCLYAATSGPAHLIEIKDWRKLFLPPSQKSVWGTNTLSFDLDNGRDLLKDRFASVTLHNYPDQLVVTSVQPLIDYIQSYPDRDIDAQLVAKLKTYLSQILERDGAIRIIKQTGLFSATKS
jgi:ubiquinone/menaquinone biosynthesis C-methylase UbiE